MKHGLAPWYGGRSIGSPTNARPAAVGFTKSWSSHTRATIFPSQKIPYYPNIFRALTIPAAAACSTMKSTVLFRDAMSKLQSLSAN